MTEPIAIIGGGIAGLATAWHLAASGHELIVFDDHPSTQASRVAAGMLSPALEATYTEEAYSELFLQSINYYDSFVEGVESASGLKTDYQNCGAHLIAIDSDDEAELKRYYPFLQNLHQEVQWKNKDELIEAEPLLSRDIVGGLLAPKEKSIDTRKLMDALKKALQTFSSIQFVDRKIEGVSLQGQRVTRVHCGPEQIPVSHVLLATGAYPGLREQLSFLPPVRPVKGVVMEVRAEPSGHRLNRILKTIHRYPAYCVPRPDGRITVGATMEEKGYDGSLTLGSLMELFSGFWRAIPGSEFMEFSTAWVGFRPTTPDNAPVIGPSPIENLSLALGYYRHGILIAPFLGKCLADWITRGLHHPLFKQFGVKTL